MLTRLALLVLLLAPAPAFAMPQAIPAVIAWIVANAATAIAIAQIVLAVGTSIYGSAQQRKAARKAKNDFNASLQDRTITKVAIDSPHVYVYGRAKVGSTIVAILTSGDKDQYKHLVCVHAAHECDGIEEIYIAGKPLGALNGNGDVTGGDYFAGRTELGEIQTTGTSVTIPAVDWDGFVSAFYLDDAGEGFITQQLGISVAGNTISFDNPLGKLVTVQYAFKTGEGNVRVRTHLGTPTDTADVSLLVDVPGKWSADAVLRGFCYTVVRLNLNQAEFQGGIPSVEVLLRGKKLYDPRTTVTAWSDNPALAIYDYLQSEMCGVSAADIPLPQVITAANACDVALLNGPVSSLGAYGHKYTLNGTVTSDEGQAAVLEKMAQAMGGGIVSTTWEMFAGAYVAPIMTLDQTDIVGGIAVTPGASDADIYNGVRGQYVGADAQFVASDFTPYQNMTYTGMDGRELWTNIDFPFTDRLVRVHNLARIFTEDQRNGYTVKATFSLKAWSLRIGDRAYLNSALFGWTNKVFRVTDKSYSPTSMIELTLKEDAPEIWDFADAVVVDATPNTDLPNPYYVAPLASLVCESGTNALLKLQDGSVVSRILVTWPPSTTQAVATNGLIEIEWSAVGSDSWERTTSGGDTTAAYVSPVQDGAYYNVRARAVNPYMNTKSDWIYTAPHQVVGKTAPPADVPWFLIEGKTLTWGQVTDIDLAGYRIRYNYGLKTSWGDASPLHAGILTQSPYTPDVMPSGQVTLMVKAVDTSGNESGTPAIIRTVLGDQIVANVVETVDFHAQGFPGVIAGGTVSGGILSAGSIANFFGSDVADFYSEFDTAPFFIDSWSAMTYETPIYTPQRTTVGSQITLFSTMAGDAINIEYRTSGINTMFPALDTEPFFGADADYFYGPPGVYQPWPGQITSQYLQYQFRFSTGQSASQGSIDVCKLVNDVPDVMEKLNDIIISAAGTRLPLAKAYTVIANVQLTLQTDGGSAVKVEIADKSNTGPLIYCRNSAGTLVSGKIDAIVQGY
jgi:hypothetical protein